MQKPSTTTTKVHKLGTLLLKEVAQSKQQLALYVINSLIAEAIDMGRWEPDNDDSLAHAGATSDIQRRKPMPKNPTKRAREERACDMLNYLLTIPLPELADFADEVEHLLEKRTELAESGVRLTGKDRDDFFNNEKELKELS